MAVVWITGASSGIGEACALKYASRGDKLILTSSRRDALEKVAGNCSANGAAGVSVLPYDFTDLSDIVTLANDAWNVFGTIDILYCNAGVSQRTCVEDTPVPMVRKIMEVNYFAPVAITEAILPKMLASGGGKIAVTTSIAGRFGFPLRCAYSSSKFALYGFFETLRAEYHDKNIYVTIVCPGRIKTNISVNSLDKGGTRHGVMDPGQDNGLPADKAADIIVHAIDRNKNEVMVGRGELIMVYIKRFFPSLCDRLSRRIRPV